MGNSLRKNIELVVLNIQLVNPKLKEKLNLEITDDNVIKILSKFKDASIKDKKDKKNISKLVDDAYEIVKTKKEIHNYLKSNNLNIKDLNFEKLKKEFPKKNEYVLYRAYLYKKYMPETGEFNCSNSNIDFKNLISKKLFIIDSEDVKNYSNKKLCKFFGKIQDEDELRDILDISKEVKEEKEEKEEKE